LRGVSAENEDKLGGCDCRGHVSALSPMFWSALEFLVLGANPKVHSALFFRSDRALYFRNIARCVSSKGSSPVARG
jgi:hypothetical protein